MPHSVDLVCHPTTPNAVVGALRVIVDRSPDGGLDLRYRLDATLSRVRIPEPRPPRIANRLWEHTCFEAFVALENDPAYFEFNLSPSGEWAAHSFRDYRDGGPLDDETLAPRIACEVGGGYLEVAARLPVDRLSEAHACAPLRIGLSAVVEAADGDLSYWALRHPLPRPDFHHREAFALRLEAV